MSSFHVILDANVLFPETLRAILLRCAKENLYRPFWSEEILAEVERNLISNVSIPEARAKSHVDHIRKAFPEALVKLESYSSFVGVMQNDPKDRYVLAAVIAAKCQVIITENIKDFPETVLAPFEIQAHSPDEFLNYQLDLNHKLMAKIIREQVAVYKNSPKTTKEFLTVLGKQAPTFVVAIEQYLS